MGDVVIKCPVCGARNRVPPAQPGRKVVCGKCKAPLPATRPLVVTDGSFAQDVEESPIPVLLDLWAEWCGPCHMLTPIVEQLAVELAGRIKVAKLNIDENPGTAARFGVRSIPTLLVLRDGGEVDRLVGVQPKQEILRRLEAVLGT